MKIFWMTQLAYVCRMLGAALCGICIGYERENNLKMAGIRTHVIVALTASMMMIISKYGFDDVIGLEGFRLDPSRIAAGVVTAVGFLAASVIFNHKMNISGLTTAAGIWATVGIGMAFGTGMYVVGAVATLGVVSLQFLSHRSLQLLRSTKVGQITLEIDRSGDVNRILENIFMRQKIKIKIENIYIEKLDQDTLLLKLNVKFPTRYQLEDVLRFLKDTAEVISFDI